MRTVVMLAALAALGACTTTAGGGASTSAATSGYSSELNALEQQCTARSGMLRRLGRYTGQPSTDYACIIHDSRSDRLRR